MENYRLVVFRAVAENLNFRKASELLYLSQPAVSQHIHALEEELGVRLFDRGGSRVTLTAAGAVLLKYANRSAKLAQEARAALAKLEGDIAGELHIGASTTVAQYVLPRLLGTFLKENPKIRLSVSSGNTERVVGWVLDRSIAVGLIEGPALSKDVHVEPFLKDRMVLIAARGHEWSSVSSVPVSALMQVPLLLREQGSGSRRVVEEALKRAGLRTAQMNLAIQLDSTEAILSGVEAGLGVGFVSQWAIQKELRLGSVVQIRVDELDIEREFSLVHRLGPLADSAAAAFARFAMVQRPTYDLAISKPNRR